MTPLALSNISTVYEQRERPAVSTSRIIFARAGRFLAVQLGYGFVSSPNHCNSSGRSIGIIAVAVPPMVTL